MSEKPTYEELAQRVQELEQEKLESNMMKEAIPHDEKWPTHKIALKINSEIHIPEVDLESIITVEELQSIMDDFCYLTNMVTAVLDLKGKVIEATGWRDMCTIFHRKNPKTALNCTESDLFLAKNLKAGEYIEYKCKNGLWDVVTPLYIGNRHLGNIYTGQFFYDDEHIDEEFYIKQAEAYGFDKDSYIDALRLIPRYNRETIKYLMSFLVKFTTYISRIGFVNIQLENEIRQRKRTEMALEESETHLRTLLNSIPELVWLKDPDGVYQACNTIFERFFGAREADIIGKTDYDFVDTELADFFRKHDRKAIAAGKPSSNEEWVTFADDGHHALLATIKTPMFDTDGKLVGVLGIARDITEQKEVEARLQQAQKMEAIGRLAGGVAHDFNNMLSIIMGYADMALDMVQPSDPLFENLREIMSASQRSTEVVRQLLAFARKQTIAPKVLDLNSAVENILKMLRRLIGEDIDLLWKPAGESCPAKMDPSQIDQLLANLAINARDAIQGVGKVTIETTNIAFDEDYCETHTDFKPGDYVMLAVSDDGSGMDKETLTNIFEPFFTTKELGTGTGLGLATVYGIVKQNNGFINVYSEPGRGSTFKIYIPRCLSTNTLTDEKTSSRTTPTGKETVLLVEDEQCILKLTKTMLEKMGYSVLAANTPDEAHRLAKDHASEIHLLMTDVVMPEMNGRDLAKQLLTFHPKLKILFMSGYTANVIAHHGVLDKGVHFIQKPFSKKDLSTKVREVLDQE